MKLATERVKKAKVVASPQVTTKSLLANAKRNKERVLTTTTSSNREVKRTQTRNTARCNNTGRPIFNELRTPEDYKSFRVARHNKKVMSHLKHVMKDNIGYSKQQMKEAQKVLKSTAKKYTDEDRVKASNIVTRLGRYPNLVCIEDVASKLKRVA